MKSHIFSMTSCMPITGKYPGPSDSGYCIKPASRAGRTRTITVPAGTFENTNDAPISMSLLLGQVKGNVLYSDTIPILRLAKMQITQDTSGWFKNTITWELADFGRQDSSALALDLK